MNADNMNVDNMNVISFILDDCWSFYRFWDELQELLKKDGFVEDRDYKYLVSTEADSPCDCDTESGEVLCQAVYLGFYNSSIKSDTFTNKPEYSSYIINNEEDFLD